MTVAKLIKELKKLPQDTTVLLDDGNGWAESEPIYLDYDKREKTVGIYIKNNNEE